jgi:hypothetical protein
MEALLFASLLTCNQAQWIAEGALTSSLMTWSEKVDVVRELMNATEPGCEFDGYVRIEDPFFDESTR